MFNGFKQWLEWRRAQKARQEFRNGFEYAWEAFYRKNVSEEYLEACSLDGATQTHLTEEFLIS